MVENDWAIVLFRSVINASIFHFIMSLTRRMWSLRRHFSSQIADGSRTSAALTVWWDSSCPLCLREINWMQKWARPGTIDFIDLASPASMSSCPIDRQSMLARFHAQERGGPLVNGAPAFALMWKHIPRLQRLGLTIGRSPRALSAFEWIYTTLFLPYIRPTFQKTLKALGYEGKRQT